MLVFIVRGFKPCPAPHVSKSGGHLLHLQPGLGKGSLDGCCEHGNEPSGFIKDREFIY